MSKELQINEELRRLVYGLVYKLWRSLSNRRASDERAAVLSVAVAWLIREAVRGNEDLAVALINDELRHAKWPDEPNYLLVVVEEQSARASAPAIPIPQWR